MTEREIVEERDVVREPGPLSRGPGRAMLIAVVVALLVAVLVGVVILVSGFDGDSGGDTEIQVPDDIDLDVGNQTGDAGGE